MHTGDYSEGINRYFISSSAPTTCICMFRDYHYSRIEITTCTLQVGMTGTTVFVIGVAECSLHCPCTCMIRLYSACKYLVNEKLLTRDLIET